MIDLALDSRIVLNTVLDCAIQEIDLLFNTENTELIGNPQYGTNFEQFLWQMTPSPNELKKYISEKIINYTYFARQLNISINVDLVNGEYRTIYVVSIDIDNGEEHQRRVYQFK
jgi:hypothetical protein